MSPTPPATGPAPLPLREALAGLTPYGAPQLEVPVLLNVNENPHPLPPEVVGDITASVSAVTGGLNRYPDRDFLSLRAELAHYLHAESGATHLAGDNVWAANGSNEIMLHMLQAFGGPGRRVLTFPPTYSMYPQYARDTITELVTCPRREDFTVDADAGVAAMRAHRPAVVLLASPNNPTGTALGLEVIDRLAEAARTTGPGGAASVLVVDEAYAEFRREGTPSAVDLLQRHEHLAVARTMSKAFGMAGARVGYLAASPQLVDALRIVRLPYHLSALTQTVAHAALRHRETLMGQVADLRQERDALVAWLRSHDLEVADSDANFVFFGRFADREAVWQQLLDRGVLIRVVGPEGWLRASIGTVAEMAAFRAALQEVLPR